MVCIASSVVPRGGLGEKGAFVQEISTLASQFQELQQAAERWKAGEASCLACRPSAMAQSSFDS